MGEDQKTEEEVEVDEPVAKEKKQVGSIVLAIYDDETMDWTTDNVDRFGLLKVLETVLGAVRKGRVVPSEQK